MRLHRKYEFRFGRLGWHHLTVSEAMKSDLVRNIGVNPNRVSVLYDRATSRFKTLSDEEKREIWEKVGLDHLSKPEQPTALLLSSTSYTPDEDFMVMLEALDIVDLYESPNLPKIQVIVTGRGPLKANYD